MPLLCGYPKAGPRSSSSWTVAANDACSSSVRLAHQSPNSSVYSTSQGMPKYSLHGIFRQVHHWPFLIPGHTGCASAMTLARKASGKAFGVITSTETPSSCSNSCRMAPMSKSVVSGVGSIGMSRSLPSWSFPWRTEPKTRAFLARCRSTTTRMATRCA